jgi:hypothetical protein
MPRVDGLVVVVDARMSSFSSLPWGIASFDLLDVFIFSVWRQVRLSCSMSA